MKMILTILLTIGVSLGASAAECVDQNGKDISHEPDVFQKLISAKATCSEATELAEACAYGSSIDVRTAGLAMNVCDKQIKAAKPSSQDQQLLKTMRARCGKKYDHMDGTMYLSMNAYCQLQATLWLSNLLVEE